MAPGLEAARARISPARSPGKYSLYLGAAFDRSRAKLVQENLIKASRALPSRQCPVASIRPEAAVTDDWGALQQQNITSDW